MDSCFPDLQVVDWFCQMSSEDMWAAAITLETYSLALNAYTWSVWIIIEKITVLVLVITILILKIWIKTNIILNVLIF